MVRNPMLISYYLCKVKSTSIILSDRLLRASGMFQLFLFRSSILFEIALTARKGIFSLEQIYKKVAPSIVSMSGLNFFISLFLVVSEPVAVLTVIALTGFTMCLILLIYEVSA